MVFRSVSVVEAGVYADECGDPHRHLKVEAIYTLEMVKKSPNEPFANSDVGQLGISGQTGQ